MSKKNDEEVMEKKIMQKRSNHNETVPINRLPIEVFCMILKQLDLADLVELESVCRKWCYFVGGFVGQKLVIAKAGKLKPRPWFFLDEACPSQSVMVAKKTLDFELIKSSFMFDLKKLKICDSNVENDHDHYHGSQDLLITLDALNFVNRLVSLEMLEVSQLFSWSRGEKPSVLRLPNLTHLVVNHFVSPDLLLDCPKLTNLKTKASYHNSWGFRPVDFVHPLSVTHLYLDDFNSDEENFDKIQNLEYLSACGFYLGYGNKEELTKEYAQKIFDNYPNLKEISLRPSRSVYCEAIVRETLENLLNKRTALKRQDVALTLCGIRIEEEIQLAKQPDFDLLLYLKQNHSKLCEKELKWIRWISYSDLVGSNLQKDKIVSDLLVKLDRVEEIRVSNRVPNEDHLIEFISRFQRFKTLKISKEAQLGASFYQKLAAACSKPWLTIKLDPADGFTDFDFAFNFKNLICLKIRHHDAGDDFVRRLFEHFKIFQFEHDVRGDRVTITKKSSSEFEFSVISGHCEVFSSLNPILEKVNKHCRGYTDDYNDHIHDCGCEFAYCTNNSYAGNICKDGNNFEPYD